MSLSAFRLGSITSRCSGKEPMKPDTRERRKSSLHFDLWSETRSEFLQCFGFAQIVRTLRDSRARFFKNYIPGRFFPFFHQNFHLNLLRYRCRNIKRFSSLRSQQLPRQSSTNTYKTHERLVTKVRHRDGYSVTLQLRGKGCTWCRFLRQQELSVGSDEVLQAKSARAEKLLGGFNDHFSGYWKYWLFMIFGCRVYFEQPCPWIEVFIRKS